MTALTAVVSLASVFAFFAVTTPSIQVQAEGKQRDRRDVPSLRPFNINYHCGSGGPNRTLDNIVVRMNRLEEQNLELKDIVLQLTAYMKEKVYGESCRIDADCSYGDAACRDGTCQCKEAFSYSPTDKTCMQRCKTTYGDTFQLVKNRVAHGYNIKNLITPTESCRSLCVKETSKTCQSFEMRLSDGMCFLNYESASTKPSIYAHHVDYYYYQRNCA